MYRSRSTPKLSPINLKQYFWDGTLATLSKYIKTWAHVFKNCPDDQIVPHFTKLVPQEYHHVLHPCLKPWPW